MSQETIRTIISALRDETKYGGTDMCRTPLYSLDADAGKMIADALEKTLWIPCEERLPEKIDSYLVSYGNGWVSIAEWDDAKSPDSWNAEPTWIFEELRARASDGYVMAWMPLPESHKLPQNA